MPLITTYTEPELATYMLDAIGPMAAELGWVGIADVQTAINATLRDYGVQSGIAEITGAANCGRLEALARRWVWQRVVDHLATNHTFTKDGQKFDRSDLQKMALVALSNAKADVAAASTDGDDAELVVGMTAVTWDNDPYAYTRAELELS